MALDKILARCHEYISELYDDNRGDMPEISTNNDLSSSIRTETELTL